MNDVILLNSVIKVKAVITAHFQRTLNYSNLREEWRPRAVKEARC
jgi:hypothetical protein